MPGVISSEVNHSKSSDDRNGLLYVIVPCLNEEDGVQRTVDGILQHAPHVDMEIRVLMIDDGSTDSTLEQMQRIVETNQNCEFMHNDETRGVGRSVLSAYERMPTGAWTTVLPGDNEISFRSIDNYVRVRNQFDVILGYLQNPVIRTFSRRIASAAFTRVVNSLYGFNWRYLNGLKMYRVEVFRGLEVVSGGHAFMAELLAKAQLRQPHLRIGEVPFVWRGRAHGSSKAVQPGSVVRAVREVIAGYRSVAKYRREIIRED